MTRLVREPLVHFLVLGAALFAVHRAVAPPSAPGRRVIVDAEAVTGLVRDFERRAGRNPSADEVRGLVDRHVETELLYREAVALGLDRGDVVVRRRLVQKMELLTGAEGDASTPPEDELEGELRAHPDRYRRPALTAFRHVFLSTERHPDAAAESARLLARLAAGADPGALGDPFLRGSQQAAAADPSIDAAFGPGFAARLAQLPERRWSGPVPSSFGLHLVRVEGRQAARPARLDEVHDRLVEAVRERRRDEARRATLARLRERYRVEIAPVAVAGGASPTQTALAERGR